MSKQLSIADEVAMLREYEYRDAALLGPSVCHECDQFFPIPDDDPIVACCGIPRADPPNMLAMMLWLDHLTCPRAKWDVVEKRPEP